VDKSKKILSILFSLYFLFAGTGFNIIDFCCECCKKHAGIELLANQHCNPLSETKDHCCEPEHKHNSETDSNEHHCAKQCQVTRLQVEIPEFSTENVSTYSSLILKQIFITDNSLIFGKLSSEFNPQNIDFSPPKIHFTGRDVLICKAVLLI